MSSTAPYIGRGEEPLEHDARRARLGFGCAGLMRLPSRRGRQRLLGEAFDRGLTHFDVARMYGLGMAEAELARFARGRREEITIATKFGIEPGAPRFARLQAPARAVLARAPALRSAIKRRGGGPREPRRYDVPAARRSLETSLRELATDHVDYFFVHDPAPGDLVDLEGLAELFEDLRQRGMVRAWGVSGDPDPCVALARASAATLFQVRSEIFAPVLPGAGFPSLTIEFGVLAQPLARIRRHLAASPQRRERWRSAVGLDCGSSEVLASLLLRDALERNREGGVLFSTTKPERIGAAVAVADAVAAGLDEAQLRAFRALVREDLGAGESALA
jgi:D-threo-aldose 1-dehydrogenase